MENVENLIEKEIQKGGFPGAVVGVFNSKEVLYQDSFGFAQLKPHKRVMTRETIFDLASLTKVTATTISIMHLIENGKLNLYDYISSYFPEATNDKRDITVFHLLTHTSGFQAIIQLWNEVMPYQEKIKYILSLPLQYEVGKKVIYSDPNYILLGELIKRVSGLSLDEYARKNIFRPLNMESTDFNPLDNITADKDRYAATEICKWRDECVVGEVHDKNSYYNGGVCGHAGLFSTINDLIIFCQMILKSPLREQILSPYTIDLMTKNWTEELNNNRGLGWDLIGNFRSSGGIYFSQRAFGHTGFTGTSIWLDPELEL